jgi:hypothetical protein
MIAFIFKLNYNQLNQIKVCFFMFCDLNVPFKTIGILERVELTTSHLLHIPEKIAFTIVYLAKTIFFSLATVLTFGQSGLFYEKTVASSAQFLLSLGSIPLHMIGLFAPVNAYGWNISLDKYFRSRIQISKSIHGIAL